MRRSLIISGCMAMGLALLLLSPAINGQTQPEPTAEQSVAPALVALDPVYETLTGGIALRPPGDSRRIEGAADPDLVVQFVQDEKRWSLNVYRYTFTEPTSLGSSQTNPAQRGLLETTAVNFATSQPGVQLLRQDVVNAGSYDVGLLAMRYGSASQRRLNQQAIFKASDRVFFVLSFNSPSSVPPGDSAEPATEQNNDPQEQQAVATFSAIVDTVHLLDRMYIKREQDERLRRTQALMINFNEHKLTQVAQKEQWLRLMRDGRDIGYIYKVEEPYVWGKNSGLLVLTRTRTKPDDATQVDAASSMWTSYDQKEEFWVSNAIVDTGQPGKTELAETGRSYHRIKNVRVDAAQPAGDRNPVMRQVPEYLLSVEQTRGSADGTPTLRELPPYYLSQASGQLLPKLLPLDERAGICLSRGSVIARS